MVNKKYNFEITLKKYIIKFVYTTAFTVTCIIAVTCVTKIITLTSVNNGILSMLSKLPKDNLVCV